MLRGKCHLLVFQWGGEQPIEWSLVLSPYSVGPVIAISLSLPCPALSSFTRSTLPPCIDIGSAWESAIEWGSLIAIGEVPGCSPPFLGTSLSTGCSFPWSVFLSSVFSSFSFLTCHLQGNAICEFFQRKENDQPIYTVWKQEQEKNEALHRCLPEYWECSIASRGLSLSRLLTSLLRYELRSLQGSPL